jgi:tetratricopeptide (TPR) repeat protein
MKITWIFFLPVLFFGQVNDFGKLISAADSRFSIKNYKEAFTEYDKAYKLISSDLERNLKSKNGANNVKPEWKHCLSRHAQSAYLIADYAQAKRDAEKLFQIDSADASAKTIFGFSTFKEGDKLAGCKSIAEKISAIFPFATRVYDDCFCWTEGISQYREAISALNLAREKEALDFINNAILLVPDSINYQLFKGEICLKMENYPLALTQFNNAVMRDSSNFKAWYLRGSANLKAGNAEQAFKDLSYCIELNPYSVSALRQRGETCEQLQQFQSAIYDYQQCMKLDKTNGEFYYRIGLIRLNELNDNDGACSAFSKAAELGFEEASPFVEECKNPKKKKKK